MSELRVVRPEDRAQHVPSGEMLREAAISGDLVGAQDLWVGRVTLGPGLISTVHHHGESESAIYIVSGHARFCGGHNLETVVDAGPGDFVFVPPHVIHVEMNLSDEEPVETVVSRSTQEGIVVNVEAPAGWEPERVRTASAG